MDDIRTPLPASPTKFLDQVRTFIRIDGKSYSTENTYVYWIKQFVLFHNKTHPQDMGKGEITAFLIHLSASRDASPNTQKLALNALMFYTIAFCRSQLINWSSNMPKK